MVLVEPFLTGEYIYLRALDSADISDDYLSWINDPKVTEYLTVGRYPQTKQSLENYYKSASHNREAVFFAICDICLLYTSPSPRDRS